VPWLHIAGVATEAKQKGLTKLGIFGTRYLIEGPVYPQARSYRHCLRDISGATKEINRIIFEELVNGKFNETSRQFMQEVIDVLKRRGCDGVILGCTEIPLLIEQQDSVLPVLDSTRLLARAALLTAMQKGSLSKIKKRK
jgi:aspartate racemase